MAELTIEQKRALVLAKARRRRAEAEQAAAAEQQKQQPQEKRSRTKGLTTVGGTGALLPGFLDTLGTLATSGAMLVPSGLAGAVDLLIRQDPDKAAQTVSAVADAGTWSPKTEVGQTLVGGLGEGMEFLSDNVIKPTMEVLSMDARGRPRPAVAALLESASGAAGPVGTSLRAGAGKAVLRNARAANRADSAAAATRLGIDLENSTLKESIVESARLLTGASGDGPAASRATAGLDELLPPVKQAAKDSQAGVNAKYDALRAKKADVPAKPLANLATELTEEFVRDGFDLGESTTLAARLKELGEIETKRIGPPTGKNERAIPGQSNVIVGPDNKPLRSDAPVSVPLNELTILSSRLTKNIKDAYSTPGGASQAAALRTMRKRVNTLLDEQFEKGMVTGDPTAKQAWIDAKAANQAHKARFSDDKVIANIVKNNYNSMEVARLVLGTSEIGHRPQAAAVVRRLKDIVGPDASEMQALRSAVYLDMFDPLFKDTPNWSGTLERMRRIRKDDVQLLNELGISAKDLDFFEKAIRVASKVKVKADFDGKGLAAQMIARFGFGHDIAVGGARMKIANMILDKALGVGQKTHQQLLSEFANDAGVTDPLASKLTPGQLQVIGERALAAEYVNRDKEPWGEVARMAYDNINKLLSLHEGRVPHAYQDSLGYWTIGVGHLIDKRRGGKLPEHIIDALLEYDIAKHRQELEEALPWVAELDEVRRTVLLDMAVNLGVPGLLGFVRTLAAVKAGRYQEAALRMLQSLWARQVKGRAIRLSTMMETGQWPES